MNLRLCVLTILLLTPSIILSQSDTSQSQSQDSNAQTQKQHKHTMITGCISKNPHNEYELVDQKGAHSMLYSSNIDFDPYIGKSVTVVGDRSAMPSTDTGTARPMPHFRVLKVQPASGNCSQ
jgi:hypothetical protein